MIQEAIPVFKIVKPPIYGSLQDLGRFGFRHLGVPWSGALDRQSYLFVNQVLNNPLSFPVLEVMGSGLEMLALNDSTIYWSGAIGSVSIDNVEFQDISLPIKIKKGQSLKIISTYTGSIWYFGIEYGFYAPLVMNSVSSINTNQRLVKNSLLYANKSIPIDAVEIKNSRLASIQIDKKKKLSATFGPEYEWLTEESKAILEKSAFTISKDSNRMGYRLSGEPLYKKESKEMLTSSVLPGTIQLLPDGQLIILMRDCQTTGGYPRILQVDESSLNQLAQRNINESVTFDVWNK